MFLSGWGQTTSALRGMALHLQERWDEAETEFQRAIHEVDAIPIAHKRGQPRAAYAEMLRARDLPGDRERARQLGEEAAAIYEGLGFHGLARRLATLD